MSTPDPTCHNNEKPTMKKHKWTVTAPVGDGVMAACRDCTRIRETHPKWRTPLYWNADTGTDDLTDRAGACPNSYAAARLT